MFELTGDEYKVIGEYTRNIEKIKMLHKKCGREWNVTPNHFLSHNRRCPFCQKSSYEGKVSEFLDRNGITYKFNELIDGCENILKLRFDFIIVKNDKNIAVIEVDGRQHFKEIEHWGGKEVLKKIEKRDSIKNEFCENNNLPILRIPYYKFNNLNEILNKFIYEKLSY